MNKSIWMSVLSIFLVIAAVGGATYAFFFATATSSSNTFATGSLSLFVDDDNESAVDNSVTGSITASNFQPGQSVAGFVSLDNAGTIDIAEIELTADTTETADPGNDSNLADVLNLTVLFDDATPDSACVGGTDLTSAIDSQVGNGISPLTLTEFDNGGVDVYDALPGITTVQTRNVCFTATFASTAGNEYQGDSVSTTFTFTANQDASQ